MLTLNLNLLYTVVNVLILFLLLRKFLYKPVMGIIAQRQKQVDDALNAAETSKKEAAAAMNAAQDKLRNVDTEAAARREAYEQQAETAKQQLLAEAQKQADAIVAGLYEYYVSYRGHCPEAEGKLHFVPFPIVPQPKLQHCYNAAEPLKIFIISIHSSSCFCAVISTLP